MPSNAQLVAASAAFVGFSLAGSVSESISPD